MVRGVGVRGTRAGRGVCYGVGGAAVVMVVVLVREPGLSGREVALRGHTEALSHVRRRSIVGRNRLGSMEIRADAVADAAYVTLTAADVVRTERFDESVLIDLDGAGQPVGIEILTLGADVDVDGIAAEWRLASGVREELRRLVDRVILSDGDSGVSWPADR